MAKRIAVIMAGGSGERFWPLSKAGRPKQLLKLTSPDETMLEEAVNRVAPLVGREHVVLAIGGSIRDVVVDANIVHESCVWAEPAKRNTLGCLAWVAASLIAQGDGECTVAVLTADHNIGEPERFRATVATAMDVAEQHGGIVTIGMQPDRPETGFGYIEADLNEEISTATGRTAYRSLRFREKPSLETAEEFVKAGNFLWNGGMFFYQLPVFMSELSVAQPATHQLVLDIAESLKSGDHHQAVTLFEQIPSISVDFAVMEHAKHVFVVKADFPWDDMGSWDALERSFGKDDQGNIRFGKVVSVDAKGCILYNDIPTTVVGVLGVDNIVVVATEGGILICDKSQAQRVREIVTQTNANP